MEKQILNIGMIGCGEISLANLKGIQNSGAARVTLAMDPVPEIAQSFAELAKAESTTQIEDVLSADNVDTAFICTPHDLHVPIGIRAAEAGKHVIVEKPVATNLADAQKLIKSCRSNNVRLTVPYVNRFRFDTVKAKDLIEKGAIGDIIGIEIRWISNKPDRYWGSGFSGRVKTDWRKSRESSGGGILLMNCIHLFDCIEYVTGLKPRRYFSQFDTFDTDIDVEDYFSGIIRYDNGAIGTVLAGSKICGGKYPDENRGLRFIGKKGQILIGDTNELLIYTENPVENLKPGEWNRMTHSGKEPGPRAQFINAFAKAVFEDKVPPVTGEEAFRSLETCVRLYDPDSVSDAKIT